jgi:3-deoxy-manno-octulosonate cytidylyltransferase (CMP-KDO synthetase)
VEAGIGPVLVAADGPEIAKAVRGAGGEAVVTDASLPSGSDRIAAALEILDPEQRFGVIVNLPGDLPRLIPHPESIFSLLYAGLRRPSKAC